MLSHLAEMHQLDISKPCKTIDAMYVDCCHYLIAWILYGIPSKPDFIDSLWLQLLQGFGVGAAAVGMTVSVYAMGRLLMNLPAGMLADHYGRKPLLVWGPFVTAVGESSADRRCPDHR